MKMGVPPDDGPSLERPEFQVMEEIAARWFTMSDDEENDMKMSDDEERAARKLIESIRFEPACLDLAVRFLDHPPGSLANANEAQRARSMNSWPMRTRRRMKIALVCGSARCLFEDLTRVGALERTATILAVNITGMFLPRAHHLVSLHGDFPGLVRASRPHMDTTLKEHEPAIVTHSIRSAPGIDRVWDLPQTGTSSLFGVRVALGLGFDRVICCGVPLDSTGRFFDDPRKPALWDLDGPQGWPTREQWREAAKTEFDGRVRSCSGFTRELCGDPWEWLA